MYSPKWISKILIIFISGCKPNQSVKSIIQINDTSRVLNALFDKDFLGRNMPGYGAPGVGQISIFGDTILLERNDSLDQYIPQSFSNHFLKRVSRDSICILAKKFSNVDFPDFMRLMYFQRTDSGFEVVLQSTCVFPEWTDSIIDTTKPCIFGMLCGGGINVAATKKGDSVILKRLGGWSD